MHRDELPKRFEEELKKLIKATDIHGHIKSQARDVLQNPTADNLDALTRELDYHVRIYTPKQDGPKTHDIETEVEPVAKQNQPQLTPKPGNKRKREHDLEFESAEKRRKLELKSYQHVAQPRPEPEPRKENVENQQNEKVARRQQIILKATSYAVMVSALNLLDKIRKQRPGHPDIAGKDPGLSIGGVNDHAQLGGDPTGLTIQLGEYALGAKYWDNVAEQYAAKSGGFGFGGNPFQTLSNGNPVGQPTEPVFGLARPVFGLAREDEIPKDNFVKNMELKMENRKADLSEEEHYAYKVTAKQELNSGEDAQLSKANNMLDNQQDYTADQAASLQKYEQSHDAYGYQTPYPRPEPNRAA